MSRYSSEPDSEITQISELLDDLKMNKPLKLWYLR